MYADIEYLNLVKDVLQNGEERSDRTGTGTKSVFGRQVRFDLRLGFPLLTTKRLHWRSIVHELLWFLSGDTNARYLNENGVSIWNEWADEDFDLGPIYGEQWRAFGYPSKAPLVVDQIDLLVKGLREDPMSRRHVVSAWNPLVLPEKGLTTEDNIAKGNMSLAPCHLLFQMYVGMDGSLSCHMYQRSADLFLGVPYNIASYALLTMMLAKQTWLNPKELIISFGDLHLYSNHITKDIVREQLTRAPLASPRVELNPDVQSIFDYRFTDFKLVGYTAHPAIKAPISV